MSHRLLTARISDTGREVCEEAAQGRILKAEEKRKQRGPLVRQEGQGLVSLMMFLKEWRPAEVILVTCPLELLLSVL